MTRTILIVALTGAAFILGACSGGSHTTTTAEITSTSGMAVHTTAKNGPPPHAPAHGYRAKHGGAEMVYDSNCGIYRVTGMSGTYYCDGYFYRLEYNTWTMATRMDGRWTVVRRGKLPKAIMTMTAENNSRKHKEARTTAN